MQQECIVRRVTEEAFRKTVLGPALKKALEEERNKSTLIGESILQRGFQDAGESKVKLRALKVIKKKILIKCSTAQNGRTSSIHHLRGTCKSRRHHQGPQFQRKNAILLNCLLLAFPNAKYKDTQRDFEEER